MIVNPSDIKLKSVTWESDNETIATVDENGLITAITKGNATIIATVTDLANKTHTAKCIVTIKKNNKPVTKVKLNKKKITL